MVQIQIIGKSGSGKHTLGSRLARDLRYAFLPSPTWDVETVDSFRNFSMAVSNRHKKQNLHIENQQGVIHIGSSAVTEFLYFESEDEMLDDQPVTDILIVLLPSEATVQRNIHERGRAVKNYELLFVDAEKDQFVLKAAQNTVSEECFIWTERDYLGSNNYGKALRTIKKYLEEGV